MTEATRRNIEMDDAEPNDIYADPSGKLWRIKSVVRQPTVEAEEVEGTLNDPNAPQMFPNAVGQVTLSGQFGMRASITKAVRRAYTDDAGWKGWQRIFRKPSGS